MTIPQAAVDAACDAYHRPGRMITNTAVGSHYDRMTAALEAAMPHLRKQIMRDIREAVAKNEATPEISQYRDGITDGLMRAHRLVEKGLTK